MQGVTDILSRLDAACDSYAFPMLDNGYVYLAATRLSLFWAPSDWAMVIEVFGFSPRAGLPDLTVSTFASTMRERDLASNDVSEDPYRNDRRTHPHDESRIFYPIADGAWIDGEIVANEPDLQLELRGRPMSLPTRNEYGPAGIELEDPDRAQVFELSRYLAAIAREQVLATSSEQRVSVLPHMQRLLVLDDWHHPDLASAQRPSELESFRQLAAVLATGDASKYRPTALPNTHWKNWPDGGTL